MNYYNKITEALSGASRAYLKMSRENKKLGDKIENRSGSPEDINKAYIKRGSNDKKIIKTAKAIPQSNIRKKYRSTRKYELDKANSHALRFFRKQGGV